MQTKKWTLVVAALFATTALSGPALAADPVDYGHDWTGFYIGAHAGYGEADIHGSFESEDALPGETFEENGRGPFDLNLDGFVGGLQAGYNWQSGNLVLGVEGDVTFVDWSDSVDDGGATRLSAETDFVGTLRGRAGFAMDNLLFFGTAGVALTDTKFTANEGGDSGSLRFKDIGLVLGGGAEYAPNENWSIKAEALYFLFDDERDTSTLIDDSEVGDYAELDDAFMVRVGVNFHF